MPSDIRFRLPRRTLPAFLRVALRLASAICVSQICSALAQEAAGHPRGTRPELSQARLSYTKLLRQSVPEYLAITVDSNGSGSFEGRKLDEPSEPRPLRLSQATTRRLFDLAGQLDYFRSGDLESHKKVANLGLKTLTYERDGQKTRAEFNYTTAREAEELVTLFEKIASVEQHVASLEYAMKYDHLSLPKELLQIQIDLDNHALADAELMIPQLRQIVVNPRFLHLAQVRAQNILQRLQR